MPQTVEVRFKGTRKDFFLWADDDATPSLRDAVLVEAERGKDLGRISAVGEVALKKCGTACAGCDLGQAPPEDSLKKVLRRASPSEVRTADELRRSEEDVRRKVIERVKHHTLGMKVSDAEWQWDRGKLTVYFTAEQRVDFRALVRDLASLFRTRIDLRQIGVRDEAARLNGVGRCGREYCCSTWLTALSPVSLSLAKDQRLALNPAQISGGCGRLLCCLKYEHDFYVAARKRFPKEGKILETGAGQEKVVAVDIFRERVFLRNPEGASRIIPLAQLREETAALAPRPAATPAAPADNPPAPLPARPAAAGSEATDSSPPRPRRRSRRRRGRGRGGPPPSGSGG